MLNNIINQRPFRSLGYYIQQHSRFMTKVIRSSNFRPCLYDVYDKNGKIIYKAGEKPTEMFGWDWEGYQADKTNLTDWSELHPSVAQGSNIPSKPQLDKISEEQKVRRARLDMMKKTDWTSLSDDEMGKGMVAYTKLDQEIRQNSTLLWCMKAKRLGYYTDEGTINTNELVKAGFQDEIYESDKSSVTEVKEEQSAIQNDLQGNPNN